MPPKRRNDKAKSAPKQQPHPPPPPPPPPLPPPESDASRVRKEWSNFIDTWYEPQKKKIVEKLQKTLLAKYKALGTPKDTQKQREMELFEKLDAIAARLAKPARVEWERRLDLAHLREDQWDDMSAEEQHAVMGVFVGFFADDVDDMPNGDDDDDDDDDLSAEPISIEEDGSVLDDPTHRPLPPKQPIPPTPTRHTFEFVNPTSFFADNMTPPNPSKKLPALSMDHLATLGPSNPGRSAEPVSVGVNPMYGFHSWASEAGIVTQPSQPPHTKPLAPSTSLSARPRATDNISRQASAASTLSSPPTKLASPQSSPPNPTTKFSPHVNTENLGKRYIGPIILEEDPDPMDEELLKSKMAEEYQQFKIGLRMEMIYQFHAEAAAVEIKLFETLLTDEGTKESRARAVQDHETNMMRLREQKEEERKKRCAEERERRREEMRQHLAQRRPPQNDPAPKTNPPKPSLDKSSTQPRPGKVTHQKENVPISQSVAASSSKLDPPSILKKSNSTLSQDEASANEALFANAKAMMAQGKAGPAILTSAQASLNEALFSNAAAMLAAQSPPASTTKNTLQPPSIMKKSNSTRSTQDFDVPQITVSFADPPATDLPAQAPTTKGKKGKKAQLPPPQPIAITEQPNMEMDAEPPPPAAPSLWDNATFSAKNAWDVASASLSTTLTPSSAVEVPRADPAPAPAPVPKGTTHATSGKKTASGGATTKKGKRVTITEEPDIDADPIVAPTPSTKPAKATKGAWGTVNAKSKLFAPPEESDVERFPPVTKGTQGATADGVKSVPGPTGQKPQLKVAIMAVPESDGEPSPAPAPVRTTTSKDKAKSAWGMQAGAKVPQPQPQQQQQQQNTEPRRGAPSVWTPPSVRVDTALNPEGAWLQTMTGAVGTGESSTVTSMMPGTLASPMPEEVDEEEDAEASTWFNPEDMNYWANLINGPSGTAEAEDTMRETLGVASRFAPTGHTMARGELEPMPTTVGMGRHVRWTPTVSGESDDESGFGEADDELATSMWMQYAISGGDVPSLGAGMPLPDPSDASPLAAFELTTNNSAGGGDPPLGSNADMRGRGKKKMPSSTGGGEVGNRVQQMATASSSVFDRAAFAGPWPKMESWLSPPSRGQNSGSARVF